MDFFQQQTRAHKKTGRLLFLFALGVICLIALTYFLVMFAIYYAGYRGQPYTHNAPYAQTAAMPLWNPLVLACVSIVLIAIISGGSLYKVAELAGGGQSVALLVGGRPIMPSTRDFTEKRLLNVVEEMAIASGISVPPVYILEEDSINAFAAGHTPSDAIVCVSRGCLKYLNRDELQGVIGHEFSHILNGDMRLNIRLMALIFGITVVSLIGYIVLRSAGSSGGSRRDGRGVAVVFIVGVGLYILGVGGAFFGQLIRAAVSRQREFLADASSVQFTRNPDGISGALKKIGGLEQGSKVQHAGSSELAHMFFADGTVSAFAQMFATHPPLEDRIRAIDAHWDGQFIRTKELDQEAEHQKDLARPHRAFGSLPTIPGLPQLPIPVLAVAADSPPPVDDVEVVQPADETEPVPATISPRVVDAIKDAFSARAVVYALLLDSDQSVRDRQLASLQNSDLDPRDIAELRRLEPDVRAIPEGSRMVVVQRAKPALRQMSVEQYKTFRGHVEQLILADKRISLFEFCLHSLLIYQLNGVFGLRRRPMLRYRSISALRNEAQIVLATLAWNGSDDEVAVRKAYEDGWRESFGDMQPPVLPSRDQV